MYALGAGPGPTKTYLVDLPFPWGPDTEVTLPIEEIVGDMVVAMPVDAMVGDAVLAAEPLVDRKIEQVMGRVAIVGGVMFAGLLGAAWWLKKG